MTEAPRNVPVPDELADVRWQIMALEKREAALRELLIANPDLREGANWLAEVREIEIKRIDIKELRAMHGDLLDEYTFPQKTKRVVLSAIDADTGEITSARRARKAAAS